MPERPVAYFITFRTYGTWMHGDTRGSVGRSGNTAYGSEPLRPDELRQEVESRQFKAPPLALTAGMREAVDRSIRETSEILGWHLHAINVRTEHAHVVVSSEAAPERVLNALKAYATRYLREVGLIDSARPVWSRHGSTRYVWDDTSLAAVIEYVIHGQDRAHAPDLGSEADRTGACQARAETEHELGGREPSLAVGPLTRAQPYGAQCGAERGRRTIRPTSPVGGQP